MKQITSPHNEIFKNLKQLASSSKYRRRSNQTLIEGVHLCDSFLQHVGTPVMFAYTDKAKDNPEVSRLITRCMDMSVKGVLLGEDNFRQISNVESTVGIVFIVDMPRLESTGNLQKNALLLEDIQDPGNMGTILRTAAAAGFEDVYVSKASVSVWSPKVLRAGMGAHFALRVYEGVDLADVVKDSEVPVMVTSLEATRSIYQHDLSGPHAWVFGNEGSGVSAELSSLATAKVIIPQSPKVESLNVAASVAVCLFEQQRQTKGL